MQEQTLYKIALITMIVGLTFLFIYSQQIDLKLVENIDSAFVAETVKVRGTITDLRSTEKAVFLKISGSKIDNFNVILFPKETVNLQEGDIVEITGKVEKYQGKKEIIADSVSLVEEKTSKN